MFSRRNRGFIGTCFILIVIVLFGYGLYMYDLKSVKLTESEAQRHHLQRSEKKINEKLDIIDTLNIIVEEGCPFAFYGRLRGTVVAGQ